MSRLLICAWDIPGRCDIRAMTYVLNAHLRRHDTYRSWFESEDGEHITRHTLADPVDIQLVPVEHGEMSAAEWQAHILATPDPMHWDCFTFRIIQRPDRFTFCVSLDHLHADPMLMGVLFMEIQMMYTALVEGAAPIPLPEPGRYDDFCLRQRQYASALTLESPEVRAWVEFAENNGGTLPDFPLPLGDPAAQCDGDLVSAHLMGAQLTQRFEAACVAANARFSGGVFACAALAEYELTGEETYYAITPTDTRSTPMDYMTTGWFTGLIPITVPVTTTSFADTARAAQASFDSGTHLATVPFDRVVELAPWLRRPQGGFPMLSFLDAGLAPLSAVVTSQWDAVNPSAHCDCGYSPQLGMWVNRLGDDTQMTVLLPNNPVARESVLRYVEAMKSVFVRVAEGRGEAALAHKLVQA